MNWQTMLVFFFLMTISLVMLNLAFFSWRRREFVWTIPFSILCAAIAVWSFFYALEISSRSLEAKLLWAQFQYIGLAFIPVCWFLFSAGYSGHETWLRRRSVILLGLIPVITIFLAFTNSLHSLHWSYYRLNLDGPFSVFDASYGPWWWIFFIYSYCLVLLGSIILFISLRTTYAAYRTNLIILLLSPLLPWIANALYLMRNSPVPQLDLGPFAFAVSSLIIGIGILHFRLFNLAPIARTPIISSINTAVFLLDPDERLLDLNPVARDTFLAAGKEPIGQPVANVFDWWPRSRNGDKPPLELQEELELKLGDLKRYFNLQITPIWNSRQILTGKLVVLRDVTGEHLMNEAVAMAKVKSEFFAKVGHELRTPLTAILGLSEILEYGVYGELSPKQREAVGLIHTSSLHLTHLVNDLLQTTQLESGKFRLEVVLFDLEDLISRLRETQLNRANAKGLELVVDVAADVPKRISGDPMRIYQVMTNLVENAIKFTVQGYVRLYVYLRDPTCWAFEVSDTGIGISPELHEQIFNPFQQANFSLTREQGGFGLGLAIVQQLVGLMNGQITLESKPDSGTTFTVTLPLATEQEGLDVKNECLGD
jgi:signal transduction histidine kinase